MSYVESNLILGEQVLYKTGLHWIVFFWPVFFAAFFGLGGLALLFMRDRAIVGFFFLVFASLLILLSYMTIKITVMAMPNKHILINENS